MSLRAEKRETRRGGRGASVIAADSHRAPAAGKRLGRLLFVGLSCALLYGLVTVGGKAMDYVAEQRIALVRVEGTLVNVREETIRNAVGRFMNQSLVNIELQEVRNSLESLEWVKQARVSRQWPDTLQVHVTEQRAIARWKEEALVNQDGALFMPGETGQQVQLPYLEGPENTELEVMEQYQKFSQLLYPYGHRVRALSLNSRGAWTITLDNSVTVKVGSSEVAQRMKRFISLLEMGGLQDTEEVESIDLRYANGIAIDRQRQRVDSVVSL